MIEIEKGDMTYEADTPYNVDYATFNSEKVDYDLSQPLKFFRGKEKSNDHKAVFGTACFSDAKYLVANNGGHHDRLVFSCDTQLVKKKEKCYKDYKPLTTDEMNEWLKICMDYGLMEKVDQSAVDSFVLNGNFLFDVSKYSLPKAYVHLCVVRHIQENPWFIRNVQILMHKYNVGFLTSLVMASEASICNSNHHFINISMYGRKKESYKESINISPISMLVGFVNSSVSDRKCYDKFVGKNRPTFFGLNELYSRLLKELGVKNENLMEINSKNLANVEESILTVGEKLTEKIDKMYGKV